MDSSSSRFVRTLSPDQQGRHSEDVTDYLGENIHVAEFVASGSEMPPGTFMGFDGPNDYDGDLSSPDHDDAGRHQAHFLHDVSQPVAPLSTRRSSQHRASNSNAAGPNSEPSRSRRAPSYASRPTKSSIARSRKPPPDQYGHTGSEDTGDVESAASLKPRLSLSQKITRSFAARRNKTSKHGGDSLSHDIDNSSAQAMSAVVTQGYAANGNGLTQVLTQNSEPHLGLSYGHGGDTIQPLHSGRATPKHLEKVDEEGLANEPVTNEKRVSRSFMTGASRRALHTLSRGNSQRSVQSIERIDRQKFVICLCRTLMLYGAPTHRLEEYMRRLSCFLGLEGQFLYLPGCMIVSFGDSFAHTSEMQIIRTSQGVDVAKFEKVYRVYKEVVHQDMDVQEAFEALDYIVKSEPTYPTWMMVLLYGIATSLVSVFAFEGRIIDMPFCFLFGIMLGTLQLVVAPRCELYSNVFDICAAVVSSFIARALGSVRGEMFCFSAMTQSAIALILPGWAILCGALELQSRNMVAGSIRIFYALMYSLFLGFGVSIGTALYGWVDPSATSKTTCRVDRSSPQMRTLINCILVLLFTTCLTFLNMAKKKTDMVAMVTIAFMGYFAQDRTLALAAHNPQIANCVGAFVVGVLGNLYSRIFKGMAFTTMLPGILLQVPSGLSSRGSMVAGIQIANDIVTKTIRPVEMQYDMSAYAMGIAMVQIAIGITVGLFMAALVVYPWGKKRTLLFSF